MLTPTISETVTLLLVNVSNVSKTQRMDPKINVKFVLMDITVTLSREPAKVRLVFYYVLL